VETVFTDIRDYIL